MCGKVLVADSAKAFHVFVSITACFVIAYHASGRMATSMGCDVLCKG